MIRYLNRVLAIATLIFQASISHAGDVQIGKQVMAKIEEKAWIEARITAASAENPIVSEIAEWFALRAGQGTIQECLLFLRSNSDWPGLPWLQRACENNLSASTPSDATRELIEFHGVQSQNGLVLLLSLLKSQERNEEARTLLFENLDKFEISSENFSKIDTLFPQWAEEARIAHVDYLLFEGNSLAEEHIEALPEGAQLPAKARLLMRTDRDGINESIAQLSEEQLAGGVAFERARYRFRARNYQGATELVRFYSKSAELLGRPEYWAEIRADLTRYWARNGKASLAYELASNHHLEAENDGYIDLEFLAGFVALEYLRDQATARQHFENLKMASNTPISSGRAGFWLGRAGDPEGYAYGARFQTSFYGQLAAEMGGLPFDQSLISAEKPSWQDRGFLQHESVHAGLFFQAIGEELLAHRFFAHEAETLDPEDAEALGLLAFELGLPHASVRIGKNLANRGQVITHSYYPIPDYFKSEILTPRALALSVMRQESEFYARAGSSVGAAGLMQLMPATAAELASDLELEYEQSALKDNPDFNIRLGTHYLATLLEDFDGRLPLVASAYNAGPNRTKSWLESIGPYRGDLGQALRWLELIPFDETRNYVQRVVEGVWIYDGKLRGGFGYYQPSELLIKRYPK